MHPQLGLVAFHTFDWGDGIRRFGVYDGVNGDGGSLVATEGGVVGSAMTIDHTAGVQLFVDGSRCRGVVDAQSLIGWRFAPLDLAAHPSGVSYDLIKRASSLGSACPVRYAHAITAWFMANVPLLAAPGAVGRSSLRALVSEHYSGTDIENSPNMERMYFSRELGRFRWERWQNYSLGVRANDQALSTQLVSDGRCVGGVGAPRHGGQWVMIRCHEWTNIVPASNPGGDSLGTWLQQLSADTGAAPLQDIYGSR